MADLGDPAPLNEPVFGPARPAECRYVTASDGVRLRVAAWQPEGAARGTVFLLQGRTECIEKYSEAAAHFLDQGFACCALDWRGQGLSQRLLANPLIGHVGRFDDYLLDLQRLRDFAAAKSLPKPWVSLGHSMGGAIAMRALQQGIAFDRAAFSAPMWGIAINPWLRRIAPPVLGVLQRLGRGAAFAPNVEAQPYVMTHDFEGNFLTHDERLYLALRRYGQVHPAVSVAGPSVNWVREALIACDALQNSPSPECPMLVLLGDEEVVVDKNAIVTMASAWPNLALTRFQGAAHELLLERDEIRLACLEAVSGFYADCADPRQG